LSITYYQSPITHHAFAITHDQFPGTEHPSKISAA
jgi:hypothetical protein